MLLKAIRKYLIIATAVSIAANASLFYAWRHAKAEQEVIREQAVAEALQGANERAARATAELEAAAAAREEQLQRRIDNLEQVATQVAERAERAEQELSNFVTEQQSDETTEFVEWKNDIVPPSVVTRLRRIQDGIR